MPFFDTFPKKFLENIHWEEKEPDEGNKFIRACLAEFIALMFFVILCCGGAITTLASDANMMEIAASFGFGIMVIAQFIGPLSGGHINCAVSFALFLAGRISGKRLVCYTAFQMAGAVFGALFLLAIFGKDYLGPNTNFASNAWDPSVFSGGQVFLAEMWGTAILIFNVFATIDHPVEGGGALGVMPISMSVMVAHLFLIPVDGCSINPTRSFGTWVVAGLAGAQGHYATQQYMFWFGPLMGAAIAAIVYEYGSLKPKRREGGGDLASRLHMAKKSRTDGGHHDDDHHSVASHDAHNKHSVHSTTDLQAAPAHTAAHTTQHHAPTAQHSSTTVTGFGGSAAPSTRSSGFGAGSHSMQAPVTHATPAPSVKDTNKGFSRVQTYYYDDEEAGEDANDDDVKNPIQTTRL